MSAFQASAYSIDRPSGRCAFTDAELSPGDDYFAALVEAEEPGETEGAPPRTVLRRVDISEAAWVRGERPERMFSHWKAVVPEPNEKKKLFVDDDVLINLFNRLESDESSERRAFRFVLALILMRKKRLKYEGTEKETETRAGEAGEESVELEWWVMAHKAAAKTNPEADAERSRVLNPRLDEAQIANVTSQLGEVLQGEL